MCCENKSEGRARQKRTAQFMKCKAKFIQFCS